MRVVELSGAFGLEHLTLTERPDPQPGPGEIVLRMRAVSLNFRDLLMVRGLYNPKQPLPLVVASDGVGEVIEVGKGVTRVAVGDRVSPNFVQGWFSGEPSREKLRTSLGGPLDGTLTEKMLLSADSVVHVPEHLSNQQAATLPCAAVTAWNALVTEGRLMAGQTVLCQGTGGVSIFALQIAKMFGAKAIVTSSSDDKLSRAKELGADQVINYRTTPDWGKAAKELTGGRGVDQVIEVGGAQTLAQSLRAVRPGGTISIIGVLSGTTTDLNLLPVLMQNVRLQGVIVGHRENFEDLNRAIAQTRLEPVVDKTFAFDDVLAAFEHMAAGKHFGKICVDVT
jgi:NADPH:quinone reductase-like Zn-dependent oxidoreductase